MSLGTGFVLSRGSHVLAACFWVCCAFSCKRQDGTPASRPDEARAAKPGALPAIDFDTRVHDFGLVNEGDPLKHVFQVTNKGTAVLLLSGASTSCGCTLALLGATQVPPGGTVPLDVSMDTHGERGRGARSITVSSNDPRHPTSTLEIRYDVEPLLGLDRSFVRLTIARGAKQVEDVWLEGQLLDQARLRVAGIDGGGPVSARIIETHKSGGIRKGVRLELRGKERSSGTGTVTLATGVRVPPELSLPFAYAID